jgi:uncharacterized protein (TIGR03067 family)
VFLVAVSLTPVAGSVAGGGPTRTDLSLSILPDSAALQGSWAGVTAESAGFRHESLYESWTFTGDRLTIRSRIAWPGLANVTQAAVPKVKILVAEIRFEVDPKGRPATITFQQVQNGRLVRSDRGYYRLRGDVLQIFVVANSPRTSPRRTAAREPSTRSGSSNR